MHEMAIAEGILVVALEKAAGERVRTVRVRVGAGQRVVPESLEMCFRVAAQETGAADAALLLDAVPGDELLVDGVELEGGWRFRPGASERGSQPCA